MRIFDGVEVDPARLQNPSGAPTWLSVLQFVAHALVAAEQCRQERLATEADRPGTLEQVMAQVGLKIPGLEEMLAQLMGNGDEARSAASMIANSPDPVSLLQQFAKRFSADANTNAAVPAGEPREAPRSGGASEQPSWTAASEARSPSAVLMPWDPGFEEWAREAVRAAEAASSGVNVPMPEFVPEYAPRAGIGVPAPTPAPARPSLVGAVRHQLDALRRRMNAHEAELNARLARAEAELAALRDDVHRRTRPTLVVVPPSDEATSAAIAQQEIQAQPTRAMSSSAAGAPSPAHAASRTERPMVVSAATDLTEGAAAPPAAELPSSASDEDIAEALGLVADFSVEADARYQRSLARITAVELEARILRAELRGETTVPAVESALP